ncbi:hypothetical protein [Arthrobacter sp. lap29]|uniref:hypothetical protein n=1 Tax=Arthrobacter sp. lap29 TaxID=3056122 RepID=UPI0028F6E5C2|nr:hypothetical protein [Arthrobacter sp. lap29]
MALIRNDEEVAEEPKYVGFDPEIAVLGSRHALPKALSELPISKTIFLVNKNE